MLPPNFDHRTNRPPTPDENRSDDTSQMGTIGMVAGFCILGALLIVLINFIVGIFL